MTQTRKTGKDIKEGGAIKENIRTQDGMSKMQGVPCKRKKKNIEKKTNEQGVKLKDETQRKIEKGRVT